jgi:hypothetical protein
MRGTKLLLDVALGMGEVLETLEKNRMGNFQRWIDDKGDPPQKPPGCT